MVVPPFYVELNFIRTLMINNHILVQLLEKVNWINAMKIEENMYPNLVKVFYFNMDTSVAKWNCVITQVGGVAIEFGVSKLNEILGTPNEGLEIYSTRKAPYCSNYSHIEAFRNICRRINLSDEVCIIHLRTQCLCLQSRVLLRILQVIVILRSEHVDEISHNDAALINCILRRRPVNLGYTLIHHMLNVLGMVTYFLPYILNLRFRLYFTYERTWDTPVKLSIL